MSYYKEKKKANIYIDEIIKKDVLAFQKSININAVLLEATNRFEVGEKVIKDRLDLWIARYPDNLKRSRDIISYKESKKPFQK